MKKTAFFYVVVLLCLLPALLLRDYTPSNELRYLSIADEALKEHHFFTFTNHGVPYADKPPLFLWLVMLVRCCPLWIQHFLFGLLTFIPSAITIEAMVRLLRLRDRRAWIFRLLTLTSALWLVSMLTLRMDMLMTMFIVLAISRFSHVYSSRSPRESLLLPLLLFLGVFTKGAVGFFVPFAVIVVFLCIKGQVNDLPRYFGWKSLALLLLLFAIWFGAVYAEGGKSYLYNLTVHQTLGRAFHSFRHRQPVYYYLYMYWPLLFPWSFLAALSGWNLFRRKSYHSDRLRLVIIATAVVFLSLSFISSKLSIYLLPLVPFALSLIAVSPAGGIRGAGWALGLCCLPLVLTAPALPVACHYFPVVRSITGPLVVTAAVMLSLSAAAALFLLARKALERAAVVLACGILIATALLGFSMPKANDYFGYGGLAQEVASRQKAHPRYRVVAVGMKSAANMDVYLKEKVQLLSDSSLASLPDSAIVVMKSKKAAGVRLYDTSRVGPYLVGNTCK